MKKCLLTFLTCLLLLIKGFGQYFQAQIKKQDNNLQFYIRANPTGPNIICKFDNLDFFVRWPSLETAPDFGTPVVNTIDFPGLTIAPNNTPDPYGSESGFIIKEYTSPSANSTNSNVTYTAGVEYLVFSVPITSNFSPNLQLAGNNIDGIPYYLTITKNTSGIGGISDLTGQAIDLMPKAHLFYSASSNAASLSNIGDNYYQRLNANLLPVKWLLFNVVKNNNDAKINWIVANSNNNKLYELQRSIDGINFNTIAIVNNNTSNNYNYADLNINIVANKILYYRIKQEDLSGEINFSAIRILKLDSKDVGVSIFPNPVKDGFNVIMPIRINSNTNKINLNLLALNGQIIITKEITISQATNYYFDLKNKNIAKGVYTLQILGYENTPILKQIIIK